jgi:hypothetical protein
MSELRRISQNQSMKKVTKKRIFPLGSSGYGWTGLSPEQLSDRLIRAGEEIAKLQQKLKFDAVAFCGSSGAAIGFHVAIRHKIPVIYVRKKDEESHGGDVECNMPGGKNVKKYLIVDDFISTGRTVEYIVEQITEVANRRGAFASKPVGIFCFDGYQRDNNITVGEKKLEVYHLNK